MTPGESHKGGHDTSLGKADPGRHIGKDVPNEEESPRDDPKTSLPPTNSKRRTVLRGGQGVPLNNVRTSSEGGGFVRMTAG